MVTLSSSFISFEALHFTQYPFSAILFLLFNERCSTEPLLNSFLQSLGCYRLHILIPPAAGYVQALTYYTMKLRAVKLFYKVIGLGLFYLTHDFLGQVLKSDKAEGIFVLIDNHRNLDLIGLEFTQKLIHP